MCQLEKGNNKSITRGKEITANAIKLAIYLSWSFKRGKKLGTADEYKSIQVWTLHSLNSQVKTKHVQSFLLVFFFYVFTYLIFLTFYVELILDSHKSYKIVQRVPLYTSPRFPEQ